MRRLVRALTANRAETAPDHPDRRLRGRTYAISFDRVWKAALRVAGSRMRRWEIADQDDEEGRIAVEATTLLLHYVDDVEVRVTLDENAQTRVDLRSRSRKGKADFGTNARRIGRFLRALDRELEATPAERLDPLAEPAWLAAGT